MPQGSNSSGGSGRIRVSARDNIVSSIGAAGGHLADRSGHDRRDPAPGRCGRVSGVAAGSMGHGRRIVAGMATRPYAAPPNEKRFHFPCNYRGEGTLTGSTIEIVILSLKPIRETDNGSSRRWAPQAPTARNNVGRSKRRRPSVATPSIISANSARFSSRISPIRCSILSGVR